MAIWENAQYRTTLLWFVFITLVIGQFAAAIVLVKAWWFDESLVAAYASLVSGGSFITFATTLLVSSTFFLVRGYIRGEAAADPIVKSFWLLVAMLLVSIGVLISFFLVNRPIELKCGHHILHWLVYISSVFVALRFWSIEYEESAQAWHNEMSKEVEGITDEAAAMTSTSDGISV